MTNKKLVGAVLLLEILLVGCSKRSPQIAHRRAPFSAFKKKESGILAASPLLVDRHCPTGAPVKLSYWKQWPTEYIVRDGYILEHSTVDKIPIWVSEGLTQDQLVGPGDREMSRFRSDPQLQDAKALPADYKGSGFDRGHQAPAANHKRTQIQMDETFFMSNMAPQTATLNRRKWRSLEDAIRKLVNALPEESKVLVITGCLFYDPNEGNESSADGLVEYQLIGHRKVAVPTHFFKIIQYLDDDTWTATAYVLPNTRKKMTQDIDSFRKSIRWIEDHTALDFNPSLDLAEQDQIEVRKGFSLKKKVETLRHGES